MALLTLSKGKSVKTLANLVQNHRNYNKRVPLRLFHISD